MKKLKRTYTRCAGLTALVLLALLIAGSFADLPISRFLYPGHESSFGQFFAAFGELPAFALLASCGVLLIVRRGEFRPELHMILLAFGVCLIAGSVFLSIHEATDNVPALPTAVALLVTLFVDALAAFAFLFMTRGCQAKTLLRFLCTVIFVCVGIMLLIKDVVTDADRAAYVKPAKKEQKTGSKKAERKAARLAEMKAASEEKAKRREKQLKEETAAQKRKAKEAEEAAKAEAAAEAEGAEEAAE